MLHENLFLFHLGNFTVIKLAIVVKVSEYLCGWVFGCFGAHKIKVLSIKDLSKKSDCFLSV